MTDARVMLAMTVALVACGGSDTGTTPTLEVSTVQVSLTSPAIELGDQTTATAVLRDERGITITDGAVEWSSSNPAMASIDANGTVTGILIGEVTITARSGIKTGTAQLGVRRSVTGIEVNLALDALFRDGTATATTSMIDRNGVTVAGRTPRWTSSDPSVASVDLIGPFARIRLLAPGTTTISASIDGVRSDVVVTVPPITSVSIVGDRRAKVGEPVSYQVDARTATGLRVMLPANWSVDAANPATVNAAGTLAALDLGEITLRATVAGITDVRAIEAYDWAVSRNGSNVTATLSDHFLAEGATMPALEISCASGQLGVAVRTPWSSTTPAILLISDGFWLSYEVWDGAPDVLTMRGTQAELREALSYLASYTDYTFYLPQSLGATEILAHFQTVGIREVVQEVLQKCP
jgi:uncharacterized protein YjdB